MSICDGNTEVLENLKAKVGHRKKKKHSETKPQKNLKVLMKI